MKPYKSLSLVLLLIFFLSSCCPSNDDPVDFIILQLNDVYEIAPSKYDKLGGMARVATLRKKLLAENPNVITVLSGDFVSPSLIGTLKYKDKDETIAGKQMVEVMNALGMDYVVPGNHEYDIGEKDHLKRIAESEFIWTTTNTWHVVDGESVRFTQHGKTFPDHIIHSIEGVDIAFFGPTIASNQADYVTYTPKYRSAVKVFDEIKDEADIFIAITHLEREMDSILATEYIPELDLILGGHDHTHMLHRYNKTLMTKADANAKTVYVHRVSYNKTNKKVTIVPELVSIDSATPDDPEVKKLVDKWLKIAKESMKNMGYTPDSLVLNSTEVLDGRESSIRERPTNYPMLTAKSFLHVVPSADLAIFNSGSMRLDDQLKGRIVEEDILRSFPFGGGISFATLKGDVIKKILDTGTGESKGTGGYLQLANVEKQGADWYIKGAKLSTSSTYKVVLPKYVMDGDETNLDFLKNYRSSATTPVKFGDIKNDVRDIVMAYFRSKPKVNPQ